MVLLKTIVFTIIVPGTVTIIIPYWLLSSPSGESFQPNGIRYFGFLPILAGAAIYLWCAWDFTFAGKGTPAPIDPPRHLVARGLYRYVRNPNVRRYSLNPPRRSFAFYLLAFVPIRSFGIQFLLPVRFDLRGTGAAREVWRVVQRVLQ